MHFYVYVLSEKGHYYYERTCCSRRYAEERVAELKKRGITAVWLQDHLIRGAYY